MSFFSVMMLLLLAANGEGHLQTNSSECHQELLEVQQSVQDLLAYIREKETAFSSILQSLETVLEFMALEDEAGKGSGQGYNPLTDDDDFIFAIGTNDEEGSGDLVSEEEIFVIGLTVSDFNSDEQVPHTGSSTSETPDSSQGNEPSPDSKEDDDIYVVGVSLSEVEKATSFPEITVTKPEESGMPSNESVIVVGIQVEETKPEEVETQVPIVTTPEVEGSGDEHWLVDMEGEESSGSGLWATHYDVYKPIYGRPKFSVDSYEDDDDF